MYFIKNMFTRDNSCSVICTSVQHDRSHCSWECVETIMLRNRLVEERSYKNRKKRKLTSNRYRDGELEKRFGAEFKGESTLFAY